MVGNLPDVQQVKDGGAVRFYLRSGEDCERFLDAVEHKLVGVPFGASVAEEEESETEEVPT